MSRQQMRTQQSTSQSGLDYAPTIQDARRGLDPNESRRSKMTFPSRSGLYDTAPPFRRPLSPAINADRTQSEVLPQTNFNGVRHRLGSSSAALPLPGEPIPVRRNEDAALIKQLPPRTAAQEAKEQWNLRSRRNAEAQRNRSSTPIAPQAVTDTGIAASSQRPGLSRTSSNAALSTALASIVDVMPFTLSAHASNRTKGHGGLKCRRHHCHFKIKGKDMSLADAQVVMLRHYMRHHSFGCSKVDCPIHKGEGRKERKRMGYDAMQRHLAYLGVRTDPKDWTEVVKPAWDESFRRLGRQPPRPITDSPKIPSQLRTSSGVSSVAPHQPVMQLQQVAAAPVVSLGTRRGSWPTRTDLQLPTALGIGGPSLHRRSSVPGVSTPWPDQASHGTQRDRAPLFR